VATQYNPYAAFNDLYDSLRSGFETGVLMLNKAIADSAQAGGYYVADVYSAFTGSEENLYNAAMEPMNLDIHPNAAGHAMIEKSFYATVAPLL